MKFGRLCLKILVLLSLSMVTANAMAQEISLSNISHTIDYGGNGIVDPGDSVEIRFFVENQGGYDLDFVYVDPGNEGVMMPGDITIPVGQSATITGNYVFTSSDISVSYIELIAVTAYGDWCGECVVSDDYGDYTIEWSNPTGEFDVYKDFLDNNPMSVLVTLSCTDADIEDNTLSAQEGDPAVFDLSNVGNNNTCTAVEEVPSGYTHDNPFDCQNVQGDETEGGYFYSCEIVNSLDPIIETFTVFKDFEDDNTDSVDVTLSCIGAEVAGNTLPASEGNPAEFTIVWDGVSESPTCSATESVPPGYTSDEDDCSSVEVFGEVPGSCTIINTPVITTASVVVRKVWTDENDAAVQVSLSCTDAEIRDSTLTANPEAVFSLVNVGSNNQCTATETVPDGYIADESDCRRIAVGPDAAEFCNIINTPFDSVDTSFTVSKVFSDESTASVQVTLSCTDASIDSATKSASMGSPAVFALSNVGSGNLCTATEAAVPGYDKNEADCMDVAVAEGDDASCQITNTKEPDGGASFTVSKVFTDESTAEVQVTLSCTQAMVDQATRPASMGNPAEFQLSNVASGNQCTATETVPDGYIGDASACSGIAVGPEESASCTITNTPDPTDPETSFTVNKVFGDGNTVEVPITLSCTAATPDSDTKPASMGSPAVFTLSEVASGNECTATETVPEPYTADESKCASVAADPGSSNECTITNSLPDGPPINPDGLPPNQRQVAKVINESCPQFNNEFGFQSLCTALAVTSSSIDQGLKESTADEAAAVRSSGMQTANIQVAAVDGRIGTLRGGGGAGFTASGFSLGYGDVAISGNLLKSFISAFDQNSPEFMQANAGANDDTGFVNEFGRWGAWISGRVIFGEKDPTLSQVEYDFDTAGLTFGLDYRFTDNFVAGVAVGYANTDADLGTKNDEMETKGYSVSLYGTWFRNDSFYLGGSVGYGGNEYDQTRNVQYTISRPDTSTPGFSPVLKDLIDDLPDWAFDVDQTLGAEYDGKQYSAAISGGWDFNKNGWTFGPTFRLEYVTVDVDAYDEILVHSNADSSVGLGWAVHVDKQKYESLQPAVGFSFSKAVSRSWGVFIPQGYVDVVAETQDGGILVNGTYRGDVNDVNFALETDDFEETFVRAGLGFGLVLKNNKSAFFMADGDLGRDLLKTYYLNAGFRWQF